MITVSKLIFNKYHLEIEIIINMVSGNSSHLSLYIKYGYYLFS